VMAAQASDRVNESLKLSSNNFANSVTFQI
jgi:hypothetical protein